MPWSIVMAALSFMLHSWRPGVERWSSHPYLSLGKTCVLVLCWLLRL